MKKPPKSERTGDLAIDTAQLIEVCVKDLFTFAFDHVPDQYPKHHAQKAYDKYVETGYIHPVVEHLCLDLWAAKFDLPISD